MTTIRGRCFPFALYCAFCGPIEQARSAGRAIAGTFAGALISRMGLPRHHPRSSAATMPALLRLAIARTVPTHSCLLGGRRRYFILGERAMAREEAQRFLNGIRSFWVGIFRADRRGHCALGPARPPISVTLSVGSPARRFARRRAFLSKVSPNYPFEIFRQKTNLDNRQLEKRKRRVARQLAQRL